MYQAHCCVFVSRFGLAVSTGTSVRIRFGSPFSSKVQESFWWWQCSDRYIISLFPHLHTPLPSSPFMVSMNVKLHVFLFPAPSYLCDCLQLYTPFRTLRFASDLWDCFQLYTPSRTLRSASDTLSLQIPRTRLSTVGSRTVSVFGPSTWNGISLPLRRKPSLDSFNSNPKTFLFFKTTDLPCFPLRAAVFLRPK